MDIYIARYKVYNLFMSKISPFFWFVDEAEEAANFYIGLFPNSKINKIVRYPKAAEATAGRPAGSVMTVEFELDGQHFSALNGGQVEGFSNKTGAVSFVIDCETQEEIDKYWSVFSEGGKPAPCGWIQDKFGITWQVVPTVLDKYLNDPDPDKVNRVTTCFMKMSKFDIAELEKAYKG